MYTRETLRFAAKIVISTTKGAKAKLPDATEGVLGPSEATLYRHWSKVPIKVAVGPCNPDGLNTVQSKACAS